MTGCIIESVVDGKHHSMVADFQDVLLVLKTLLTHKVNHWQKGRYLGGGENTVEVKEALDLFALGEKEIIKGGVLEEVMRRRNKGKRGLEFGRDLGEAEAACDMQEEADSEEESTNVVRYAESEAESEDESTSLVQCAEPEVGSEEEGRYGYVDLSAEDLESVQMSWCPWKGITEFDVFSESSEIED